MQVTRADIETIDAIIAMLNKLRFDVNGIECMKLASYLHAFGSLRTRIKDECDLIEMDHQYRVKEALAKMAENQSGS